MGSDVGGEAITDDNGNFYNPKIHKQRESILSDSLNNREMEFIFRVFSDAEGNIPFSALSHEKMMKNAS